MLLIGGTKVTWSQSTTAYKNPGKGFAAGGGKYLSRKSLAGGGQDHYYTIFITKKEPFVDHLVDR